MRNAFAKEITELAQKDERIVLLSADIGNRLFDDFKEKCPGRFYNCGVAEANMIGVAAGMAMSGLRPVCYTITNFVTYRCLEQIRVDICYHHQPVLVVGTGSGLSYASLGGTHQSCEEMGMLRLLPGLAVVAPADSMEVRAGLRAAFQGDGPVYMRIGKKGEPNVHPAIPDFSIGKAITLREGEDACILSTGTMLSVAMEAAGLLAANGCSARVVSFHTVKPLDEACLAEAFSKYKVVATVEEHSVLGGLGGSIAEWLSDQTGMQGRLVRFGTRDEFLHETCEQESAREIFGLTAEKYRRKNFKLMPLVDFVSLVHKSTKRDYLARVTEFPKAEAARRAREWGYDYWDGDRKTGYGGMNYDGRWRKVAQAMVDHYKLKPGDKVLDIGCGKGFLLYDFTQVMPGLEVYGVDISEYAIENAKPEIKDRIQHGSAAKLPFGDHEFDLVVSITTFHNLYCPDLFSALKEVERVGKDNKYICVESYRNEEEKVNLLYWQLTCEGFYTPEEWDWWFELTGYTGDYSYIYFE